MHKPRGHVYNSFSFLRSTNKNMNILNQHFEERNEKKQDFDQII